MSNFYGAKLPINFKRIIISKDYKIFENVEYLKEIWELYNNYIENLEDDFSPLRQSFKGLLDFIEKISPHFYVITYKNNFCGFISLENIVGTEIKIHSAEVSICLKRKYWGKTAAQIANIFKNYCFKALKITKLKALIYPQNRLAKNLLYKCGFKKEATLKSETIKNGKPQNIEIYALINNEKGGCNAV